MTLDEAYNQYIATGNNDVLGEPILEMLRKTINKTYGSKLGDLEDAVQDVCVEIFRDLPNFHGESKFSTWVTKVANTTCLDIIKKNEPTWEPLNGLEEAPSTTDAIEARTTLYYLLKKLPTIHRRLVELKLQGYSSKEIAVMLDYKSYDVVDDTYKTILEKLKTIRGDS